MFNPIYPPKSAVLDYWRFTSLEFFFVRLRLALNGTAHNNNFLVVDDKRGCGIDLRQSLRPLSTIPQLNVSVDYCSTLTTFVPLLGLLHQLVHRDVSRLLRNRRTCQNPLSWIIGGSQALHSVTILQKAKSALHQLVHRDVSRLLRNRRTCQNPQ